MSDGNWHDMTALALGAGMVGADDETFAKIKPVIECWAGVINHLGPVGSGHTMKLINNFISMGYGALFAEALAIARKAGLTVQQVDDVIRPGRMSNGFYETFMKWTLERDENAHRVRDPQCGEGYAVSVELGPRRRCGEPGAGCCAQHLCGDGSGGGWGEISADAGGFHRGAERDGSGRN